MRFVGLMRLILTLAVPVLLVVVSIRLAMLPFFTTFEYTRAGFPEDFYGFSTEDRLEYGRIGIEYLLNGDGIEALAEERLPIELCWNVPNTADDCAMFNELELIHMEDVKEVLQASFLVAIAISIASLGSIWYLRQTQQLGILWQSIMQGSFLTLASIITIIVIALGAWDTFFDTFHAIFFEDGTWRFLYSDTLIRLYPEQFWFDAALFVGGLTSIGSIFLWLLGWRMKTAS
jgi:integral membrane protein (TIGR01906 family)